MDSQASFVFNFQQYIQFKAIDQGYPYFPNVIRVLFDEAYYRLKNPDVSASINQGEIASGAQHFFAGGALEGRSPSAFFDEELYLIANPDVKAAVENGSQISGLWHYVLYGFNEGRDALAITSRMGGVKLSALFDEAFYLRQYRDVAEAVQGGGFAYGYEHFLRYGLGEGRVPSHLYDEQFYLAKNSDIKQAVANGAYSSGLVHYLLYGHRENRLASPLFNPKTYQNNNPDVANAVKNGGVASLFAHFLEYGAQEGRLSTHFYEEKYYLDHNPDVRTEVENGRLPSGYVHFLQWGIKEGRSPSAFYDEQTYLFANPDVYSAVAQGNQNSGLEHYLKSGILEDRPLSISGLNYLASNKAVLVNLDTRQVTPLNYGANFRLMPLGDSITQGVDGSKLDDDNPSYANNNEGYRLDLQQAFRALELPVDFVGSLANGPNGMDRDHEGHGGKGFSYFLSNNRINTYLNSARPDIILLMLGTNDGGPQNVVSGAQDASIVQAMLAGMKNLLNTILANQNFQGQVLIGTLAPAHPDGEWAARNQRFTAFNNALANEVAKIGSNRLRVIEVGSLLDSRRHMADPQTEDNGLHPNQQGYSIMADAWYEGIEDILFARSPSRIDRENTVIGSQFNDVLIGNSQANVLEGWAGDDVLTGNGGADRFVFRKLGDGFDRITDFGANDTLQIFDAGFAGDFSAGFSFVSSRNPSVIERQPTFLYNRDNGVLSYDPDGIGTQAPIAFLQLTNQHTLTAEQISIL
jgi:serralysin